MKSGHQTTGNTRLIWSHESSFTLFPTAGRVYVWRTLKEAYNRGCLVPAVKDGLGSVMIWAEISWYSVGLIITLRGRITARKYMDRLGNQEHLMLQTLIPSYDTLFKIIMPPFTQLELFSHGLKSMKVKFSIFPGQHYHQILTSLKRLE
jgi:hypothetical protein